MDDYDDSYSDSYDDCDNLEESDYDAGDDIAEDEGLKLNIETLDEPTEIEDEPETSEETTQTRTWRDAEELSARYLDDDFQSQQIFLCDDEGRALRDENGEYVMGTRREAGSVVPDHIRFDEEDGHAEIVEDKIYTEMKNLEKNIDEQTESRIAAFGEDADITFRLIPNHEHEEAYTIESLDHLQEHCEEKGVNFEFLWK